MKPRPFARSSSVLLGLVALVAVLATACGGGPSSPSNSAAASRSPAGAPAILVSPSSQSPGAAAGSGISLSGAFSGAFVPHGHYHCEPILAVAGTIGSHQAQLEIGNGRLVLLVDEGDNPAGWSGSGVSLSGSAYQINATLSPSLGAHGGDVHMSGALPCS
jgi:hypothetical protein